MVARSADLASVVDDDIHISVDMTHDQWTHVITLVIVVTDTVMYDGCF